MSYTPTGDVAELIEEARTDLADADRCTMMQITPATGTLHRRLREVTAALEAKSSELASTRQQLADAEAVIAAALEIHAKFGTISFDAMADILATHKPTTVSAPHDHMNDDGTEMQPTTVSTTDETGGE